ncbi:uncharacterized protein BDR25DRAFT_354643 [Lindgomyces ingoldianus]|uniref:Uncharacterized protein n=1 Tax=Lindgomyces ingoldianus TaxID=673940 RepID=A0ACB6QX00_9PLEO|nr:uncharacterized protein BDR25DRAFT_354643 [Lindgomyces ingoldianus]KAF2471405.1 hypothetical protein BDR25DRAFT_354643 [Lindgomyces ingoldianus]
MVNSLLRSNLSLFKIRSRKQPRGQQSIDHTKYSVTQHNRGQERDLSRYRNGDAWRCLYFMFARDVLGFGEIAELLVDWGGKSVVLSCAYLLRMETRKQLRGVRELLLGAVSKGYLGIVQMSLVSDGINKESPLPFAMFWLLMEWGANSCILEVAAEASRRATAAGMESMLASLRSSIPSSQAWGT